MAKSRGSLCQQLAKLITYYADRGNRQPEQALVLVGDEPAAQIYVRNRQRTCVETGIVSIPHLLPASTSQTVLPDIRKKFNEQEDKDGILL